MESTERDPDVPMPAPRDSAAADPVMSELDAAAPAAIDLAAADPADLSDPADSVAIDPAAIDPAAAEPAVRIAAAIRLIEAELDADIPIERLAAAAHYSMFHFHRLFRGLTGESVRGMTRRLRLERAAYRLRRAPASESADILGIAQDAGYASHAAFTRAFAARFGMPPSAWRTAGPAGDGRGVADTDPATVPATDPAAAAADLARIASHPHESLLLETSAMDIRLDARPASRIAFVRHVGPYNGVADAWKKLYTWGWPRMLLGKPQTFGLCHDDPDVTVPERVRYDACMVVGPRTKAKPSAGIEVRELPAGSYVVALHAGAYERLGETYARLFARVASGAIDGRTVELGDPPSLEVYLNDPRKTAADDLRTEIWMPIRSND
ncbi:MAG: GyrI-like domain-containing protein [Phycisphaerales bacterium]